MVSKVELDDSHHVVRHVTKANFFDDDCKDLNPSVFFPRPTDQGSLSVNHLEYYGGDKEVSVARVIEEMTNAGRSVRRTHYFIKLNVGKSKKYVFEQNRVRLSFVEDAYENEPSHSGILGCLPDDDTELHIKNSIAESIALSSYFPAPKAK